MKKTIRLTESDLHKLIGESVKRILSESNAWADQQPVDKNHPDWWYYRQEIEPDEIEDFDDGPIGESKLRNIVRESIKRVINEEWYPENENDIDDYYYGAIFKFDTDLVYFDEDENIPEDLLNIKDEYIESQNTYTSVMVTNVEPEVDETDGSASFTITAAINAPNMPLDEIEEEVTNTVWVWLENKLNKRFTRVWIEGEEVVYDRRSVE